MKLLAMILIVLVASSTFATAQGNPSGPGSVTGDPAASTASPNSDPFQDNRPIKQSQP